MAIEKKEIFIQLEPKIEAKPNQTILIKDVASVFCLNKDIQESVKKLELIKMPNDKKNTVIFVLNIIDTIKRNYKDMDIVVFGNPEILVDIQVEKSKKPVFEYLKLILVCLVLSIGAGLAIINFHEDVNMEEAHRTIYYLFTGSKVERPFILQIPYSLGIGIGMGTFFSHIFKKKWKKEPSPLEVEMYLYDKNINDYVLDKTKHIKNK